MKKMAWSVFLAFILVSAAANYAHGDDKVAGALMAVVPVGFAAVIFLLENMVARGKGSWPLYVAAGVVGLGAGVASYVGLMTFALGHGVPRIVAYLLPLAYDGVVAVASLAIRSLGEGHDGLAQLAHAAAETARDGVAQSARSVLAQPNSVTPLGHPGPPQEMPVGQGDMGQLAHLETAGQGVAHEGAGQSSVEVAHDVAQPEIPKPARPRPRAINKSTKKRSVGHAATDPEQVAQAVEAVRSRRLTQREAASEFGISRTTLQRALAAAEENPAPTVEELELIWNVPDISDNEQSDEE